MKKALEKLASECGELSARWPGDPKIGQAQTLLNTAAAAIKVELPQ